MRKLVGIFALGIIMFTVSLAGGQTLTWTAGGVGGGWYTIAGASQTSSMKNRAGHRKSHSREETVNPRLVDKGDCELGWGFPSSM